MLGVLAVSVGCATKPVASDFCRLDRPILWENVQELDATPERFADEVSRHNDRYERLCPKFLAQ